jgi:uncharacterized protein YrzB (UPF0473 family)
LIFAGLFDRVEIGVRKRPTTRLRKKRGIGMAQDPNLERDDMEPQEEMTVTLTLDDGSELECVVLTIFTAGERDYIALLPMNGPEAEEGEVYLYRYSEEEDGQPNLENIEDDEEYEIVADAFDELLDDAEYDELVGEDEDEK